MPPARRLEQGGQAASECLPYFRPPVPPERVATEWNGVALPDVCFLEKKEHHVFVIGDWGGVIDELGGATPHPADRRKSGSKKRVFVPGADDTAQHKVRNQMQQRAAWADPDYIINVGDTFYWGGPDVHCGDKAPATLSNWTSQWGHIFEDFYFGPGLDGKQWLGVLGNHDYGGFKFTGGWDQVIRRTWAPVGANLVLPHNKNRWIIPGQYWRSTVHYPDFSVDYFFTDTNIFNAFDPWDQEHGAHNICGVPYNDDGASCGASGPSSVFDCLPWFQDLWDSQADWLRLHLATSRADWQIVVTHFPPHLGTMSFWEDLVVRYGVDLLVTGHKHMQEVYTGARAVNGTVVLVSGGGGGITSEAVPDPTGEDDQYGFMHLVLSKEAIQVTAISHGGQIRSETQVLPRPCAAGQCSPVSRSEVARRHVEWARKARPWSLWSERAPRTTGTESTTGSSSEVEEATTSPNTTTPVEVARGIQEATTSPNTTTPVEVARGIQELEELAFGLRSDRPTAAASVGTRHAAMAPLTHADDAVRSSVVLLVVLPATLLLACLLLHFRRPMTMMASPRSRPFFRPRLEEKAASRLGYSGHPRQGWRPVPVVEEDDFSEEDEDEFDASSR